MRILIRYFASFKERTGLDTEELDIMEAVDVRELTRMIMESHGLSPEMLLVAVNGEFANPDRMLREYDIVALFPPVAGG